MRKSKISLSTTHIIMLSFLCAVFIGSLLLSLPISWADGVSVSYLDALFTATTATCVTGLVTVPTFSTWSLFGQVTILLLIQIGGLGIITIMSGLMILLNRKMGVGDRMLIQDAFNLNTMSGLVVFVKKVFIGTLVIEAIGALLYMPVFVSDFGAKGIWFSVFNSVSAFCNAGIDVISGNSLCDYATHPLINFVTCSLIILGGIGYVVWWDIIRVCKEFERKRLRIFKHLTLQSKIAIVTTLVLISAGTVLIFIFEYNNPQTIGSYSLWDKIQVSFFQSVTTRTAGFATVPQENLMNSTSFVSLLLMFIGGSPVGTAGGIKTVTIAILICCAVATIKNKNEATIFNRNISRASLSKAIAVTATSFAIVFVSTVLLSLVTDADAMDILFETVSATATVGLSRSLTPTLNSIGKIVIIATMYLGRVGPISLAIALGRKNESRNIVRDPTEELSVG